MAYFSEKERLDKLLKTHIGLIKSIANSYSVQAKQVGHEPDDVLGEAYQGFLLACERYNPDKGFKFTTFATHYIRGAVLKFLYRTPGGTIRIPYEVQQAMGRLAAAENAIINKYGNLAHDQLDGLLAEKLEITLEKLDELRGLQALKYQYSLDGPASSKSAVSREPSGTNKYTLADVIPDNRFDLYNIVSEKITLRDAIRCLSERQQYVVRAYNYEERSFREIGQALHISESGARQLHRDAIKKMRRFAKDSASISESDKLAEADTARDTISDKQQPATVSDGHSAKPLPLKNNEPICVHKGDVIEIAQAVGVNHSPIVKSRESAELSETAHNIQDESSIITNEWVTAKYIKTLPGGNTAVMGQLLEALQVVYAENVGGIQAVACPDLSLNAPVRVQIKQSGRGNAFYILKEDLPKIESAVKTMRQSIVEKREIAKSEKVASATSNKLPIKTEAWATIEDAQISLKCGKSKIKVLRQLFDAMRDAYNSEIGGIQTIACAGLFLDQTIHVQMMQSGTKKPICILREDLPIVKQAVDKTRHTIIEEYRAAKLEKKIAHDALHKLPIKTDEWAICEEAHTSLKGGESSVMKQLLNIIRDSYNKEQKGIQTVVCPNMCLNQPVHVQMMQSVTRRPICIFREDLLVIEQAVNAKQREIAEQQKMAKQEERIIANAINKLPIKTEAWATTTDARTILKDGESDTARKLLGIIRNSYDEETKGVQLFTCQDMCLSQPIRIQIMQSGARTPVCIFREDLSIIEQAIQAEKEKRFERKKAIHHDTEMPQFTQAKLTTKTFTGSAEKSFKPSNLLSKDISPNSPHIKQSGRSMGFNRLS